MMAADLPMQDVRAQYAELKATLSTFQASVGDCLERAEAEFLQAYRAHMVEVHRSSDEPADSRYECPLPEAVELPSSICTEEAEVFRHHRVDQYGDGVWGQANIRVHEA